jgi:hypothetical protein
MSKDDTAKKQYIFGFIVIAAIVALLVLLLHWLWHNLSKELLVTLVVAATTVVGSVWTARSTKLKDRELQTQAQQAQSALQIQAQQAEKREDVCKKFMSDLWIVTQEPSKAVDQEFVRQMMKDVMVGGLMWWSDQTVKKFVEFRRMTVSDSQKSLIIVAQIILSMRSDLGHKNNGLTEKDVLDVFLQDTDELFKGSS